MAAIDEGIGMEDMTIESLAADVMELAVDMLAVKMRVRALELRDVPVGPSPSIFEGMSQEQIDRGNERLLKALDGVCVAPSAIGEEPTLQSRMMRVANETQAEHIERLAAEITSLRKRMQVDDEHLQNAHATIKRLEKQIAEGQKLVREYEKKLERKSHESRISTTTGNLVAREVTTNGQLQYVAVVQRPLYRQVGVVPTMPEALRFIAEAMEKKEYGY